MNERRKLTRELFIKRGHEQNAADRRMGIPAMLQIDPEEAWHSLYGKRAWVYLELDRSGVPFGGSPLIVDDELGNGNYGGSN